MIDSYTFETSERELELMATNRRVMGWVIEKHNRIIALEEAARHTPAPTTGVTHLHLQDMVDTALLRQELRLAGRYAEADALRTKLCAGGVEINDKKSLA